MSKEIWRPIYGYTGLYEVSSHGRIKSLPRKVDRGCKGIELRKERILKPTGKRYRKIHLSKDGIQKWFSVHRLVAKAFCKKLKLHTQVNHVNGNRLDNSAENLAWCTASENCAHALSTGLSKPNYGEAHYKNKLSWSDVKKIRKLRGEDGLTYAAIGKIFNTNYSYIWEIVNYKVRKNG